MLDAVVRNEGKPDVVQISGGEPTVHPRFFEVLDAAWADPASAPSLVQAITLMRLESQYTDKLSTYKQQPKSK